MRMKKSNGLDIKIGGLNTQAVTGLTLPVTLVFALRKIKTFY